MRRKLSIAWILLALSLGLGWPGQWRTTSLGKAKAANAGRAVASASFQQGQRLTVQFRTSGHSTHYLRASIPGGSDCPERSTGIVRTNTPSVIVPFAYECREEKLTGQAVWNFPAGPLSGTLDASGDLVLDAAVTVTVRAEITAQISERRFEPRRILTLCAIKDDKEIDLTPKQWSVTCNYSLSRLSRDATTGSYSTGLSSSPEVFFHGGRYNLRSTAYADYTPPTCPSSGLQVNALAQAESSLQLTPHIEVAAEITSGKDSPTPIVITALKDDGTVDSSYNGTVQVRLATGTTDKIGVLKSGAQSGTSLSLPMEGGRLKQPLALQTPKDELTANSVLKPGDPVLEGRAVIEAALTPSGGCPARKEVRVRSPLDLKIDRIEVQQGVKPVFESDRSGPWVQHRDLLIRVFLDANRTEFSKYVSIEGITAQLTVRAQSGAEIAGSPFPLSLGAFAKGTDSPSQPYVFQMAPDAQGSESLNHILYVTQEQLNLSVALDDVYPDKDPTNNEKPLPPLRFVTSKPLTVLYSPAKLKSGALSTFCPTEAGIAREINFVQLAYPVSLPESAGRLRFIQAPNPNKNEACEVLTDDPLPVRPITEWWFWLNRTKRSDVKAWVYFVDHNFFPLVNRPGHAGISDSIGGSVAIVSDRCLGPDTGTQCGVLAHELGHIFSLGDTYQSTAVTPIRNLAVNPPQADSDVYGNPVGSGTFSWFHHRFSVSAKDFYDFMGASNFSWTDRVNWNYLRTQLLPASNSVAPTEPDTLAAPAAADNFVIVQGQVRQDGAAEFTTCYTLTGEGLADASGSGAYVIETLDSNAAVLNSLSFTPSFRLPDSNIELEAAAFSFALPFSNAVRQLRIRSTAGILATRQVSAAAPVVSFTSDFGGQTLTGSKTVRWAGSDADGQALSYSLFYSPDGQLQIPLALETTDTSCEWDTAAVPAGAAARLTLTATDGVNATTIESRTFTLPNRAPKVVILAPAEGQQFKPGEPVNLEAALYDPEEGLAWRPVLTWSSNLQGALGTGKQLAVSNLQAGTHLITAAGADSHGARGSASVTVIVRPDNFSNLAVAQTNLDFGNVAVGLTRDLTLNIHNSGNAPFTVNAITSSNARFAATTPAAPFAIAARSRQEVNVRFTPVAAGDQTGALTIATNASNRSSINISLAGKATGATVRAVATVSAASFSGAALAREAIVTAFGVALATTTQVANALPLPTELAGTTVRVRDSAGAERLAPLFFVSPGQINYLIPPGTATGTATITVTSGDGALSLGTVNIAAVAPGLFTANATGQGVPAAVALRIKADGAQSFEPVARFDAAQNRFVAAPLELGPAGDQLFLLLFGTGLRFNSGLAGATCKLGGLDAPVLFAGEQGGFAGLDQVNLGPLPRGLTGRGEVDLVLTVDGQTANTVRVAFAGAPTCSYAIAPASQSFATSGGAGSVNVTAPSGCAWTATSNAGFITLTGGASGSGPGTVNYLVAANTATGQRTGTLTVAGQAVTITQAAAAATVTVRERRLTGGPIPDQCAPPLAKTAFLTTDARVYQWTLVSGARNGDVVRQDFIQPNGSIYFSTAPGTINFNGDVCFSAFINLAGTPAAALPGNWQVRVIYNGTQLLTDNFTIAAAPAGTALLRVDDSGFENSIGYSNGAANASFVNRLTPTSYPATLREIQLYFGNRTSGLSANTPITLLVAVNPNSNSNIDGSSFQTFPGTVGALNHFNVYTLPASLTINSGDFVVGFRVNNAPNVFPAKRDTTPPSQMRSYASADGSNFEIIDSFGATLAGNFGIRALVTIQGGSYIEFNSFTPGTYGSTGLVGSNVGEGNVTSVSGNRTGQVGLRLDF